MAVLARRALGIFAHPDDESFSAGGLLAFLAARDCEVFVVSATRGERGGTAALRSRELSNACEILGAQPPRFLDLPDSRLDEIADAEGTALITQLIDEIEPDLLITLGNDGAYGHLDHIACTRWLTRAVGAIGVDPPRVLHSVFPRDLFRTVWRKLRKSGRAPIADVPRLGVDRTDVDLTVHLHALATTKRRALAAHVSQLRGADPNSFLGGGLTTRLLEQEWYELKSGPSLPAATLE